jgi:hypothetical protein
LITLTGMLVSLTPFSQGATVRLRPRTGPDFELEYDASLLPLVSALVNADKVVEVEGERVASKHLYIEAIIVKGIRIL